MKATTGKELFINRLVDLIAKEIKRRKVGRLPVIYDAIETAREVKYRGVSK